MTGKVREFCYRKPVGTLVVLVVINSACTPHSNTLGNYFGLSSLYKMSVINHL